MRPTQLGVIGSLFHEGVLFTSVLFAGVLCAVRAKTLVVTFFLAFVVAFFIAFLLASLDLSTSLTAEVVPPLILPSWVAILRPEKNRERTAAALSYCGTGRKIVRMASRTEYWQN